MRERHWLFPLEWHRLAGAWSVWRETRTVGMPLPEKLWAAAEKLAQRHGVYPTARALGLEYNKLKRLSQSGGETQKAPQPAGVSECRIELEGPRGGRMRIELSSASAEVVVGLCRVVWGGGRHDPDDTADGHPGCGRGGGLPQRDRFVGQGKEQLQRDPFSGCPFVFRSRRATSIKVLVYDGQGFWLCQKRLSSGRFRYWPTSATAVGQALRPTSCGVELGASQRGAARHGVPRAGVPHHITQRGNRREDVFFNEADRAAYLAWLGEYCAKYKVCVNGLRADIKRASMQCCERFGMRRSNVPINSDRLTRYARSAAGYWRRDIGERGQLRLGNVA